MNFQKLLKKKKIKATVKFQFRDLNTFIHKDFIHSDEKYVKRFMSTKLENKDFKKLDSFVKKK